MRWRLITCLILAFCIVLPSATVAAEDTDVTGTVPLVASDISASNIGYYGATISWETNDNATSQVFYDTVSHDNTTDYADHTAEDTDLVTEHSVPLTGLSSGTTYHYRVRSAIPDTEFITISEDYTFTTLSPAPYTPPPPPPAPTIETDLFGEVASFPVSSQGEILETIEATSEDGMLTMTIPKGTIALDKDSKRLASLETAVDESPPDPVEDAHIIGLAYDFGPSGAMFSPQITLTWNYDPDVLPEGVTEESLIMAYYEEAVDEWIGLVCVVDTENNTITASVSHFTAFAVIGSVTPPPVPPPAPAAFSVSSLSVLRAEVGPGQTVTISVSVTNTGGESGSYTVVLKIDAVKEAEERVTIAAGGGQWVSFSVTKEEAGSYTVAVDGLSGSFTVVPVIVPPDEPVEVPLEPAAFSVSNLSVTPLEVESGETVTITALVANTGDLTGSYEVTLKINNTLIDTKEVTLAGGTSQTVTFTTFKNIDGAYTVTVATESGTFEVTAPEAPPAKPFNWFPLIAGVLGVAAILSTVFYLLRVSRSRAD